MKKERSFTYLTKDKSKKAVRAQHPHIFMTLMALAMMILAPQGAKAQEYRYYYYNFADWARDVQGGPWNLPSGGTYKVGNVSLAYGTKSPEINGQVYDYMDFSRFAFRHDKGWKLRYVNDNVRGLVFTETQPLFVITGLYENDEIKITYRSNNASERHLYFYSGSAKLKWGDGNNLSSGYDFGGTSTWKDIELVATANGDIVIKSQDNTSSDKNILYITYIEIKRPVTNHWAYNPPATEIYNLNNSNGTITNNDGNATPDFSVDGVTGSYLYNPNGDALNNRLAVRNDFVEDFTKDGGLKNNSSSGYAQVLSIANLNAGDRVRITYSGYIRFGSDHDCATLTSKVHNEEMNDGQLTEADGEHLMEAGQWLDPNLFYTMDVAGHLDIVLSAGTVITKIEIYSDYPTTMLDRENGMSGSNYQGWTGYFPGNGVLDNKEHIVPGGLHVIFGTDNANEKAYVIQSDAGPVSYINDYQGFKPARRPDNDINNKIPTTGTFYKFKPEVSGTIHFKFKAKSIRYEPVQFYYDKNGGSGVYAGDNAVDHEHFAASGEACPYALYEVAADGVTLVKDGSGNGIWGPSNKATDATVTVNNDLHLEAEKTYVLFGNWNRDFYSGQTQVWQNNRWEYVSSTAGYCGVAELIDVTFIPDAFVYPLAKWVENNTTADANLAAVAAGTTSNELFVKKTMGNITGCEPYITDDHKLAVRNITYGSDANKGGVILIKVGDVYNDDDPVFALTVAYSAEQGHTWDFSTYPLNGLTWNDRTTQAVKSPYGTYYQDYFAGNTNPNTGSLLYQETVEGDWNFQHRLTRTNSLGGMDYFDPMFANQYALEGDNADMYYETEGLVMKSSGSMNCIFNEFKDNDNHDVVDHRQGATSDNIPDPDRYIGLMTGSELIIPKLKKDDRVIIYMGAGSGEADNTMFFNITNARDAVYNEIDPNDLYHPGGSMWNANSNNSKYAHGDHNYRGCYHFFAKEDGDMVFKLNDDYNNVLCKLYKIQIYRGDRISTNSVNRATIPGTNNQYSLIFISEKDGSPVTNHYNMHYLGKGEIPADGNGQPVKKVLTVDETHKENCEFITTSGHVTNTNLTISSNDISYTNTVGDFGDARLRLKCLEMGRKYVSDIADRNLTIGYKDKIDEYPYTWDFTDIKTFSNAKLTADNAIAENPNYATDAKGYDLSLWDADGKMIVREKEFGSDNTYEVFMQNKNGGGNQLWAGDVIIPETRGLWFYFDNNDGVYNGCMQMTSDGIRLANTPDGVRQGWWNYKMIVPDIPANASVYLRMERDENVGVEDYSVNSKGEIAYFFATKFQFANMSEKVDLDMSVNEEQNGTGYKYKFFPANDDTSDYIVAIKNTSEETQNLTFTLNGWIMKKLGVSLDEKKIGTTGYATESRERVIDHRLTSFFTGKPVKAYIGKMNSDHTLMALTQIDIMDSAPNEVANDGNLGKGCILYNNAGESVTDKTVSVFDDGTFNLFVPDMHLKDENTQNTTSSGNGSYVFSTNFAQDNDLKACVPVIDPLPEQDNGKTRFILSARPYKKDDNANDWGSSTRPAVEDGKLVGFYHVNPKTGAHMQGHQAYVEIPNNALARIDITFDMFEDIDDGVATKVEGVENAGEGNGSYMTISGQRVERPTKSGIYIKNGKKIVVK